MRIQSPLSNLRDVLDQAKQSARKYGQQFQKDEAGTRLALIDPILASLGWQLWNPEMVRVETTSQPFRADYLLLAPQDSPHIIVEAKPLGTPIGVAEFNQVFAYAAHFKVTNAVITNGDRWVHFEDAKTLGSYSLKMNRCLSSDPIDDISIHLIRWLDAGNVWLKEDDLDTVERRLAQVESDTQTLLQKSTTTNPVVPGPPVPPPSLANFVNLSALPDVTGTRPSQLRLPDGKISTVGSWGALLVECCKFSLTANPSITIPFPDAAGKTVDLLNGTQLPYTIVIAPNGSNVYVRRLYAANGCVANAKHILAQVPSVKMLPEAAVVYG